MCTVAHFKAHCPMDVPGTLGGILGLPPRLSLRLLVLCELGQVALPLWMTISFIIEDKCSTA